MVLAPETVQLRLYRRLQGRSGQVRILYRQILSRQAQIATGLISEGYQVSVQTDVRLSGATFVVSQL